MEGVEEVIIVISIYCIRKGIYFQKKKKVEQERQCFSLNVKLTVLATLEKFWLLENIWDPLHLPECQCCKYGGIKCNSYVGGRDLNR